MEKISYKSLKKYNSELHFNHNKPWTTEEMKTLMNKEFSDADLSLILGRTSSSISNQRCVARKVMK